MKLSFVIPCYRSEETIEGVVDELRATVSVREDVDYEIIMVSDHSPDGVYGVIERLCAADPIHLKGLELSQNFGQHSALMAGYGQVSGDVVVSLDDDGQTPIESVYELVDSLERKHLDVVYGSYASKKHSLLRNIGSRINDWMTCWLLNKPRDLKVTSYFAARRFVVDEMIRYTQAFPYVIGLVFRVTRSVGNVPVNHRHRVMGTSGYTLTKLLGLWINGFTAFSVKPLRLASMIGAICAVIGFLYSVYIVLNKLFINPAAPLGYSSLMSVMLFVGGMIMLMLGLIGEYVGRIYICINKAPQYVIGRMTPSVKQVSKQATQKVCS